MKFLQCLSKCGCVLQNTKEDCCESASGGYCEATSGQGAARIACCLLKIGFEYCLSKERVQCPMQIIAKPSQIDPRLMARSTVESV